MDEVHVAIACDEDVVRARQAVRAAATALGFSLVELTKLVTAASELARNTLVHGGGGEMTLVECRRESRHGLRVTFRDAGPGIADIGLALQDGFTTGDGLGLGLGGARRLVSEMEIDSEPGRGTCATVTKWL